MSKRELLSALIEVGKSPGGSIRRKNSDDVLVEKTPRGHIRVWRPDSTPTPTVLSPQPGTSRDSPRVSGTPSKRSRRCLNLTDEDVISHHHDSGSDGDSEESDGEEVLVRAETRRILESFVQEEIEGEEEGQEEAAFQRILDKERLEWLSETSEQQARLDQVYEGLDVFSWSEDFSTFSGQEKTYTRDPGPTIGAQEPVEIFKCIWDNSIMSKIVEETNRYAWNIIAPMSETETGIPENLRHWDGINNDDLYRYFAVLIHMSTTCYRSKLSDYWTTGIMGMPEFRKVISKNKFLTISRFLHFVNNEEVQAGMTSYDKKIFKVRPVLDHCNEKFSSMYIPNKHLSLDESLLLWKGRLSWMQCIRTKAARFGIKSYELCEATTGYQLRCLLYAGKDSTMSEEPIHGFENCTAKAVLELMVGFLGVGHTLVMDNWYNQLPLTRFLNRMNTDVIGTMNPRVHVPDDIKNAKDELLKRGDHIARHCGDISLVAWKDVKLVTAVSTYHDDKMVPTKRAGEDILKPESILDYNKYMGGVDRKDQKISMFPMERKRGKKWYMKVFRRLLNTSLLNAFIIYTKHPLVKPMTHRQFREAVANRLLSQLSVQSESQDSTSAESQRLTDKNFLRLTPGPHFPINTGKKENNRCRQLRCVRCTALGRRSQVTLMCKTCLVPLCVGACWEEYHTLENLK